MPRRRKHNSCKYSDKFMGVIYCDYREEPVVADDCKNCKDWVLEPKK